MPFKEMMGNANESVLIVTHQFLPYRVTKFVVIMMVVVMIMMICLF